MCTPVLSMALTAISTVTQMQAQQAQANYQAQVAERNAKIAAKQAESEAGRGAYEEQDIRRRAAAFTGAQKVAYGASGLDVGGGTPLDVLSDTAYLGELDAQTSRFNTANRVWALQNQSQDYISQAGAYRAAGKNAAMGTLLTGASSLVNQYSVFAGGGATQKP